MLVLEVPFFVARATGDRQTDTIAVEISEWYL
jgi:hypothetical protein